MSSCVRPGAHDAGFRGRRKARHAVQAGTMHGVVERPVHAMRFVAQLRASNLTKTTMFSLVSAKDVF